MKTNTNYTYNFLKSPSSLTMLFTLLINLLTKLVTKTFISLNFKNEKSM